MLQTFDKLAQSQIGQYLSFHPNCSQVLLGGNYPTQATTQVEFETEDHARCWLQTNNLILEVSQVLFGNFKAQEAKRAAASKLYIQHKCDLLRVQIHFCPCSEPVRSTIPKQNTLEPDPAREADCDVLARTGSAAAVQY